MAHVEMTNYYEILEIHPEAPPHEIQRAYQRARATYSNENPALYSMFTPEEARELLRLVEEAYSVLGNHSARRSYDEALTGGATPSAADLAPKLQTSSSRHPAPTSETPSTSAKAKYASESDGPAVVADAMVRKVAASKPLEPGKGKTQFGTYQIDEKFEAELARSTSFDGPVLQKTRVYKNIGIDRMSEATRVSRTYLVAVEANNYSSLPAAVFVRGFVVQMARILGLDEGKVAASYMKQFKAGGGK